MRALIGYWATLRARTLCKKLEGNQGKMTLVATYRRNEGALGTWSLRKLTIGPGKAQIARASAVIDLETSTFNLTAETKNGYGSGTGVARLISRKPRRPKQRTPCISTKVSCTVSCLSAGPSCKSSRFLPALAPIKFATRLAAERQQKDAPNINCEMSNPSCRYSDVVVYSITGPTHGYSQTAENTDLY